MEMYPNMHECSNIQKFKYAIGIDGDQSSWTWNALLLASDAVPFLVESDFDGLYSEALFPFYHYVPIKKDQSDLLEKFQMMEENPYAAKEIVQRS